MNFSMQSTRWDSGIWNHFKDSSHNLALRPCENPESMDINGEMKINPGYVRVDKLKIKNNIMQSANTVGVNKHFPEYSITY